MIHRILLVVVHLAAGVAAVTKLGHVCIYEEKEPPDGHSICPTGCFGGRQSDYQCCGELHYDLAGNPECCGMPDMIEFDCPTCDGSGFVKTEDLFLWKIQGKFE